MSQFVDARCSRRRRQQPWPAHVGVRREDGHIYSSPAAGAGSSAARATLGGTAAGARGPAPDSGQAGGHTKRSSPSSAPERACIRGCASAPRLAVKSTGLAVLRAPAATTAVPALANAAWAAAAATAGALARRAAVRTAQEYASPLASAPTACEAASDGDAPLASRPASGKPPEMPPHCAASGADGHPRATLGAAA